MTDAEWIAFFSKPEIAAFNRTMAENADAPLPRLVFADWVEENCQEPKFVAAMRKSIDEPEDTQPCSGLPRVRNVLWRFRFGRLSVAVEGNTDPTVRTAKKALFEAVWRSGWVGHVSSRRLGGTQPERWRRWLADPVFELVEHLDFCGKNLDLNDLRQLCAILHAPLLRTLDLSSCQVGDAGVLALSRCDKLAGLRELNLSGNLLTAGGAAAIIGSKALSSLIELDISWNPIGDDGVQHFLHAKPWQPLKVLSLWATELTAKGVGYIASAPCLSELEELRIRVWEIGPAGAAALANSRYLPEHIRAQWRAVAEGTA